jgi:hypothetical protein
MPTRKTLRTEKAIKAIYRRRYMYSTDSFFNQRSLPLLLYFCQS